MVTGSVGLGYFLIVGLPAVPIASLNGATHQAHMAHIADVVGEFSFGVFFGALIMRDLFGRGGGSHPSFDGPRITDSGARHRSRPLWDSVRIRKKKVRYDGTRFIRIYVDIPEHHTALKQAEEAIVKAARSHQGDSSLDNTIWIVFVLPSEGRSHEDDPNRAMESWRDAVNRRLAGLNLGPNRYDFFRIQYRFEAHKPYRFAA